jgi:hypothetical protein
MTVGVSGFHNRRNQLARSSGIEGDVDESWPCHVGFGDTRERFNSGGKFCRELAGIPGEIFG